MRPPLKPHEVGPAAAFTCVMDGCKRGARQTGDGFALPFCIFHIDQLSRPKFERLCALAKVSPYDHNALALAQAYLQVCLSFLRAKKERL